MRCWGLDDANDPLHGTPHIGTWHFEAPVAQVQVGFNQGCALLTNGRAVCWNGPPGRPEVRWPERAQYLFGNGSVVCAHLQDGTARCVDGSAVRRLAHERVVRLAGAARAGCGLLDGKVTCWGSALVSDEGVRPIALPNPATSVSVNQEHACALLLSGKVTCWGANDRGQLGLGDSLPRYDYGGIVDLGAAFGRATQIATGRFHSCALSEQGRVKCWGANDGGQLGIRDATRDWGSRPSDLGDALPVVGSSSFYAAHLSPTAGEFTTCARAADGAAWCWSALFDSTSRWSWQPPTIIG